VGINLDKVWNLVKVIIVSIFRDGEGGASEV